MKRFLFILTLVVSLLLPCAQNVYAAVAVNLTFADSDKPYTIENLTLEGFSYDGQDYVFNTGAWVNKDTVFCYFDSGKLRFVFFNSAECIITNGCYKGSSYYPQICISSSADYLFYTDYVLNDNNTLGINSYSDCTTYNLVLNSTYSSRSEAVNLNNIMNSTFDSILLSNKDLTFNNGDYAGITFFRPPQKLILGVQEPVLIQAVTQENPLKEILKLLPMAIPCLIGYAALRKALRTLATILKTA